MADIVELIKAEHARIGRLCAECEAVLAQRDGAGPDPVLPRRWEILAAVLEEHADTAEEIVLLTLYGHSPSAERNGARATLDDIRAAVAESRLHRATSPSWRLAVLAACAAARDHIEDLERGALARFRGDAAARVREALGRQWLAYVAARSAVPDSVTVRPGHR